MYHTVRWVPDTADEAKQQDWRSRCLATTTTSCLQAFFERATANDSPPTVSHLLVLSDKLDSVVRSIALEAVDNKILWQYLHPRRRHAVKHLLQISESLWLSQPGHAVPKILNFVQHEAVQ